MVRSLLNRRTVSEKQICGILSPAKFAERVYRLRMVSSNSPKSSFIFAGDVETASSEPSDEFCGRAAGFEFEEGFVDFEDSTAGYGIDGI